MTIHVVSPGLLSTVQDLGRHGYTDLGVGTAGAMDRACLRLANMLVGNDDGDAAIEITLRGPRLRFASNALIALSGACIEMRCNGKPIPMWRPVQIRAGSEIESGAMTSGSRAYLAVRGGFAFAPVLGSRSVDVNSNLGPCAGLALKAGDQLPMSESAGTFNAAALDAPPWSIDPSHWFDERGDQPIALIRGEHFGLLDVHSQNAVFEKQFVVGSQSNRVGYRLEGCRMKLSQPLELISEGTVPGTLQLPPGGEPIVLMAEAPTTGGYPRIGHVAAVDLDRLAQRRPGQVIRFVEVSLRDAQTRYLQRERELLALRRAVSGRLEKWLP
ncbi:MAG: biotin-dependent carboxyltransferase family protein [Rudaea sp.]